MSFDSYQFRLDYVRRIVQSLEAVPYSDKMYVYQQVYDILKDLHETKVEVERLKQELVTQFEAHLKVIDKYRKALEKCSPYKWIQLCDGTYLASCKFCKVEDTVTHVEKLIHAKNCEYVKLTGGDEGE